MQYDPQLPSSGAINVQVTESYGEWFVHTVGGETLVSFEAEDQARSYAAGQQIRLRRKAR